MLKIILRGVLICFVLGVAVHGNAFAQDRATGDESLPVDANNMIVLVKTTVIAVNHANRTADYSVLHALAAPAFRDRNSPEDLKRAFADLRDAKLDLAPVILYRPKFTSLPTVTANGLLRLKGYFPTRPVQVNFDMVFQAVRGQWRPYTISLRPSKRAAVTAKRE